MVLRIARARHGTKESYLVLYRSKDSFLAITDDSDDWNTWTSTFYKGFFIIKKIL